MREIRDAVVRLLTVAVLACVVLLAGCGGDDEIDAGTDPTIESPTSEEQAAEDGDDGGDAPVTSAGGHQLTESRDDLTAAQPAPITEVVELDEQTLGVRFQNGSEPCSLAQVTVDETDTTITVSLQTGLHPNAAAMSCIAQVIDYEIEVALAEPVAGREIIAQSP